jgi:ADP-ribose pyrophosphatase YjhB (NUDIX family)
MLQDTRIEQEIVSLAQRYGEPLRVTSTLADGAFSPLTKQDRVGEVCMVVRRRSGGLLTARKTYYPPGITRLLTGGIAHGEPIEQALLRETYEETGLNVVIRRFLAVIDYRVQPAPEHAPPVFLTCALLLDETGGTLQPQDEDEQIATFSEVSPHDLPRLADTLEQLADEYHEEIAGTWQAWGRFRAIGHRVVHRVMSSLSVQ